MLLSEGIGDTLRISLAADPVEEVKVGFDILEIPCVSAPAASTSSPVSLLLPSGVRRHRHRQCPGRAAGRHHHPDGCLHHRLRVNGPGRRWSPIGPAGAANKSAFYEGPAGRQARQQGSRTDPGATHPCPGGHADPANQIQVDKRLNHEGPPWGGPGFRLADFESRIRVPDFTSGSKTYNAAKFYLFSRVSTWQKQIKRFAV